MNSENITRYMAAIQIFADWHSEGYISHDCLLQIDTNLREKYGLSSCSIFAEIASELAENP